MTKIINAIFDKLGYSLSKKNNSYPDIVDDNFWKIYNFCKPYTMTSVERMHSLYCAVYYILANNIKGDFVECGVWRGGSSMLIASILQINGIKDRKIYLFDTYEGMPDPTINDIDYRGKNAIDLMKNSYSNKEESVWCLASLEDVKQNLSMTNYAAENIVFVKGKVEDTISSHLLIGDFALLRLDTDWYESTKHELIHLYPKLSINGILIIDDYGHWSGSRRAVDEYFIENSLPILLNSIDYTGRLVIKTSLI
jgi:O-methyltransferase